jgi:NAD(P)-dependent dehydrogenase (short-subunit alcohol dehydrogenase family)
MASTVGADRLVASAVGVFGRLDGLVDNAGIIRDRMLVNMTDDDWEISLRVNARATFAPSRAAARHWRDRTKAGETVRAALVNTSSESGVFANAGQSNYAAAKAGVAALTEVWHKELNRYGVRVNGILPRARTRLTEALMPTRAEDSAFDALDPGNVSPFVAYLLSDACDFSGQSSSSAAAWSSGPRPGPSIRTGGWRPKGAGSSKASSTLLSGPVSPPTTDATPGSCAERRTELIASASRRPDVAGLDPSAAITRLDDNRRLAFSRGPGGSPRSVWERPREPTER